MTENQSSDKPWHELSIWTQPKLAEAAVIAGKATESEARSMTRAELIRLLEEQDPRD